MRGPHPSTFKSLALLGVLSLCVGCGSSSRDEETVTVSGKVTVNGQPVPPNSVIIMESKMIGVSQTIDIAEDGTFTSSDSKPLPVGTYTVAVRPKESGGEEEMDEAAYEKMMDDADGGKPSNAPEDYPVPPKYRKIMTSDRKVDITAETNDLTIDFDS